MIAATAAGIDQDYFDQLVTWATGELEGDEVLLANVDSEITDFVRLNNAQVRQAGTVTQATLGLDLIDGRRHTEASLTLALDLAIDQARVTKALDQLREQRALVGEDPYLLYNTNGASTESIGANSLPAPEQALDTIRDAAGSNDMVGIYAAGVTAAGFANSLGQRNWHQSATFNLDWSFYLRADKAAKNGYAGFVWDDQAFAGKVGWSEQQLSALAREPIDLAPGEYRTYLAPSALNELVGLLSWGGFGEKSHRTKQTPLLRMVTEGAELDRRVNVSEDTAGGVAPNFQSDGFARPGEVVLIADGAYNATLVSPRSAQEYGIATNGASAHETPESVAIAPGGLATSQAMAALGEGLHIGNLWYTNFSDRPACRTTGMTRFATFWVEGGEIAAPVNVMRFDDTIYNLLGDGLVDLTNEAEVVLDASTYGHRSTASSRVPGVLVEAMKFTL